MDRELLKVIYANSYGIERKLPDQELGLVPNFTDKFANAYAYEWVPYDGADIRPLLRALKLANPRIVVAVDLDFRARLALSLFGKYNRFVFAVRSDKNKISRTVKRGVSLAFERGMYRLLFGALLGTSELTFDYYSWRNANTRCLFPYATDARKFTKIGDERARIRDRLGLADTNYVFLAAVKFHPRENPLGLIRTFCQVAADNPGARLIVLGSGPQHGAAKEMVPVKFRHQVLLPGYIPYSELQGYFFAADAFVHLAECEPWGVSVQDALYCQLPVIATDQVGAAIHFMQGQTRQFIVRRPDDRGAAELMRRLLHEPNLSELFSDAHRQVRDRFTAERVAKNLLKFFQSRLYTIGVGSDHPQDKALV
jgi:glycosyltransferase involved in cell wall biosynthesis